MQSSEELAIAEFNKLRILNNKVLIKPKGGNDEVIIEGYGGKKISLFIDTSFETEKHAPTIGEVVKIPNRLVFDRKSTMRTTEFDVDMELKVGDMAIYHYLAPENCIMRKEYVVVDKQIYFIVNYDQIFCAKRGDEVVMVNGYILVEPVVEDVFKSSLLITPDTLKDKNSPVEGIVRYIGTPVRNYLYEKDIQENADEPKVGDTIMFTQDSDIPLQYDLHASLDGKKKFFRMQRKDIFGIVETVT